MWPKGWGKAKVQAPANAAGLPSAADLDAVAHEAAAQEATGMSSTSTTAAPKESVFEKIWNFFKGTVKAVENGIEDLFGNSAASAIESAAKALIESNFGPVAVQALEEATDVATGQLSISKATSLLISAAEAAGKSLSQAAALQVIALLQNHVATAGAPTVTPAS